MFDSNLRLRKRLDDLGGVICGAQAIILNAENALADLLVLQLNLLLFTAEDAARAMAIAIQFARDMAPALGVNAASASALGTAAFGLAWIVKMNNQALGTENVIPGNQLKGTMAPTVGPTTAIRTTASTTAPRTTSSTSSSSSSSLVGCLADCTMVGAIKRCQTQCPTPASGAPPKGTNYEVKTTTIRPWHPLPYSQQFPMKDPVAACAPGEDTAFPQRLFVESYAKFCLEADKSFDELRWMVNATGEQDTGQAHPFLKRDPPPTAEQYSGYNITLWWKPASDSEFICSKSCKDAFNQLAYSECGRRGDEQDTMAGTGGIDVGCGSYSYSIFSPSREPSITCRNHPLSAPQYDSDADGGPSVGSAINQWCGDNHGKRPDTENIYWRWGITQLGVPNRSSFWLRATANSCDRPESIVKDECVKSLTDGMTQCDPESVVTHGLTASIGCLVYDLDLSGVTRGESPPWDEKPAFPAPEFAPGKGLGGAANKPLCYDPSIQKGQKIFEDDLNKAIDAFCIEGKKIEGFGEDWEHMFRYPPDEQDSFYQEGRPMHLNLGAENKQNGGPDLYDNMDWCKYVP